MNVIFNIFVVIIAVISMAIAFFLLMISMSQNINQAIWEYGVLRSMGVTKDEGKRLYIYEAFVVVSSSSILGIIIGFCASLLIISQLFTILEFKLEILFPWILLLVMLLVASVTTFIAVYLPIRKVNERQIASVLKAGA